MQKNISECHVPFHATTIQMRIMIRLSLILIKYEYLSLFPNTSVLLQRTFSFFLFQNVAQVKILKKEGAPERFKNIEVRVGDTEVTSGHGHVPLTANTVVGTLTVENADMTEVFAVNPAVAGRYVALQLVGTGFLDIDEINVTEG